MKNQSFQPNLWLDAMHVAHQPMPVGIDVRSCKSILGDNVSGRASFLHNFLLTSDLIPQTKEFFPGPKDKAQFEELLHHVVIDISEGLKNEENFPKKIKCAIFEEFVSFSAERAGEETFETYIEFWDALYQGQQLDNFLFYFFRKVANIYLTKLRLITVLLEKDLNAIPLKALTNPNVFLKGIFQKGSSSHLESMALDSNQYSWYRPSSNLIEILKKYPVLLGNSSMLAFMDFPLDQISHSQGSKEFGEFLHLVLHEFPLWIQKGSLEDFSCVHSCLFDGELAKVSIFAYFIFLYNQANLESVVKFYPQLSFKDEWEELFLRIIYDLEFMILLQKKITMPKTIPGKATKLSSLMSSLQSVETRSSGANNGQISLFRPALAPTLLKRIVLFVNEFPRNNPHFFLLTQITNHIEKLSVDGILCVFSQKKLFVPSLSDKVDSLLEKVKLLASFTFEELKGKGELPPYLYIFTPRKSKTLISKQIKLPALSIRITGELPGREFFSCINEGMAQLFISKRVESTPLYQKELSHGILFEFFQDAIVEGQLVNSSSKDTTNITHPTFFKALTKSCIPMNHFFTLDQISKDGSVKSDQQGDTFDFFKMNSVQLQKYTSILVIDVSHGLSPKLEFISPKNFSAKRQAYGHAYCHYFGLIPKFHHLNINFFKDYFASSLGPQIIQLSLNGEWTKIKAKVGSILIPEFFMEFVPTQAHKLEELESLYTLDKNFPIPTMSDWKRIHTFLEHFFNFVDSMNAYMMMDFISYAIAKLKILERDFYHLVHTQGGIYCAPFFMEKLTTLPTRPLCDIKNKDFYIQWNQAEGENIAQTFFEKSNIISERTHQGMTHYCELFNSDGVIAVKIFGELDSLEFLKFILSAGVGMSIEELLNCVSMPYEEDFSELMRPVKIFQENVNMAYALARRPIDTILRDKLLNSHGNPKRN